MTILKNDSRQSVAVAVQEIALSDFADGAAQAAIELPGNAIVVGGFINVTEAFDAATTATLSLGDVDSANRYANAVDLKTLGKTDLTVTGYLNPRLGDLIAAFTEDGASTVGKLMVVVEYIELSKTCWTQG